ncbi:MAG: hypothetical protein JNK84_13665 [Phreatobacter sp.]|uniref:hypothetical protein n=1 Tax=Phreatobacter sp. TaxID=1966341 RepID=UPI001A36F310|nr:hypothetical protein [Phreatobacter sp.]MBL8570113.1 hypothetical protein [Phreatobacter sp.]
MARVYDTELKGFFVILQAPPPSGSRRDISFMAGVAGLGLPPGAGIGLKQGILSVRARVLYIGEIHSAPRPPVNRLESGCGNPSEGLTDRRLGAEHPSGQAQRLPFASGRDGRALTAPYSSPFCRFRSLDAG